MVVLVEMEEVALAKAGPVRAVEETGRAEVVTAAVVTVAVAMLVVVMAEVVLVVEAVAGVATIWTKTEAKVKVKTATEMVEAARELAERAETAMAAEAMEVDAM